MVHVPVKAMKVMPSPAAAAGSADTCHVPAAPIGNAAPGGGQYAVAAGGVLEPLLLSPPHVASAGFTDGTMTPMHASTSPALLPCI